MRSKFAYTLSLIALSAICADAYALETKSGRTSSAALSRTAPSQVVNPPPVPVYTGKIMCTINAAQTSVSKRIYWNFIQISHIYIPVYDNGFGLPKAIETIANDCRGEANYLCSQPAGTWWMLSSIGGIPATAELSSVEVSGNIITPTFNQVCP